MLFESINYGSSGSLLEGYTNNPDDLELMISCETMKMNEYLHNVSVAYMKAEFNEYARNGHISESSVKMLTEGLGDYLRRFWEWLKKLWNTIWSKLKEWWNKLFGSSSSSTAKGDSDPAFSTLYAKLQELDTTVSTSNSTKVIGCHKQKLNLFSTGTPGTPSDTSFDSYSKVHMEFLKNAVHELSQKSYTPTYTSDNKASFIEKDKSGICRTMKQKADGSKTEIAVGAETTTTGGKKYISPANNFATKDILSKVGNGANAVHGNLDAWIKTINASWAELERNTQAAVKQADAVQKHHGTSVGLNAARISAFTTEVGIANGVVAALTMTVKDVLKHYYSDLSDITHNFMIVVI